MGLYGILSMLRDWPAGWPGWLALAFLVMLLGLDHPVPADGQVVRDRTRRMAGYLCLLVFVLCMTPVPFAYSAP
jgi:hypothetical protein